MSNTGLTGIQLAAALAEEIYRRNTGTPALNVFTDLEMTAVDAGSIGGLVNSADCYYSDPADSTGFVGRIVSRTEAGINGVSVHFQNVSGG